MGQGLKCLPMVSMAWCMKNYKTWLAWMGWTKEPVFVLYDTLTLNSQENNHFFLTIPSQLLNSRLQHSVLCSFKSPSQSSYFLRLLSIQHQKPVRNLRSSCAPSIIHYSFQLLLSICICQCVAFPHTHFS